jgi:hypothetical protein
LDVLFVVDNSGSMEDNQEKLGDHIGGFVLRLASFGLGWRGGLHVGVVTTDDYGANQPEDCQSIGSLVTSTTFADCGPWGERRYVTDEDDVMSDVPCAAAVGTNGANNEQPMMAIFEAIGGYHGRPGGCNEGFHRPESGLLLVLVTDEDAYDGSPQDWWDRLVFAHGSDNISIFALLDVQQCATEDGGTEPCPSRLADFAAQAPHHWVSDIKGDNYGDFFQSVVVEAVNQCGSPPLPEP